MASGDNLTVPSCETYSKSSVPLIGALIDYVETSVEYLRQKAFTRAENLHPKVSKGGLSSTFMAAVCLLMGLAYNVKFEVVTVDEEPLVNDLHFMLLSQEDKLYIDDIDVTKVMWCLEASDALVVLISCIMVWTSSNVNSPLSEYLYLPWLGATMRGLILRQTPTAGALLYTMAVVNGNINPLFLTAFSFLFLLEVRLWLEVARLVRSRWERRGYTSTHDAEHELQTLWSNDDMQSVEMHNYVY